MDEDGHYRPEDMQLFFWHAIPRLDTKKHPEHRYNEAGSSLMEKRVATTDLPSVTAKLRTNLGVAEDCWHKLEICETVFARVSASTSPDICFPVSGRRFRKSAKACSESVVPCTA